MLVFSREFREVFILEEYSDNSETFSNSFLFQEWGRVSITGLCDLPNLQKETKQTLSASLCVMLLASTFMPQVRSLCVMMGISPFQELAARALMLFLGRKQVAADLVCAIVREAGQSQWPLSLYPT